MNKDISYIDHIKKRLEEFEKERFLMLEEIIKMEQTIDSLNCQVSIYDGEIKKLKLFLEKDEKNKKDK